MSFSVIQNIIITPNSLVEDLKNKILAALFSKNTNQLKTLIGYATDKAKNPEIGETDEKYLRQTLTALIRHKHLLDKATGLKQQTQHLKNLLADKVRQADPGHMAYETWEKGLDLVPWQRPYIFSEAITFQMTSGCSNFCRRCNEWALPKVRRHFSFAAVNAFIDTFIAHGNKDLALYGGSDPLDWCDFPHDITHVLSRLGKTCQFSLLTKIPRGKGDLAKALIKAGIPMSVSLTDRNRDRIRYFEKQMGQVFTKQHATADLLIPAGLDEDFATVKPSITDGYGTEISLDGCFAIIPAFTSALHPFGHKKIRLTAKTTFIPRKKIGRPALLVDYFKPLEVVTEQGFSILPGLLDVQVENILFDNGRDELTPPGMRSIREYFDIFSDKARLKRKSLTPSVVKRIKNRYLSAARFHDLSSDKQTAMKIEILDHVRFTKKDIVARARTCSISFFLAAICAYIQDQPIKCRIIRHLTQQEHMQLRERFQNLDPAPPIAERLENPDTDPWLLFRYYALTLIHDGPTKQVEAFIQACPAAFHPEKDRFIPAALDPKITQKSPKNHPKITQIIL
ncbi:hypothetical protein [Desulfobacter hydrogenophilus]|uniref:hypothetical protein n=1 Tax=Desulfobacter hydrogenophilus TaxID=2291 RepID=UPI001F5E884A|nr:hypothetical protein [Desulfobacter hydrogenophilus]